MCAVFVEDTVVEMRTGGKTYSSRLTVNWPSFVSASSSRKGFNGSQADLPNDIFTVATTLPGLEIRIKHRCSAKTILRNRKRH